MPAYTPPSPPGPTGNAIADVQHAFSWSSQFFTVRASAIRFTAQAVLAGITKLG